MTDIAVGIAVIVLLSFLCIVAGYTLQGRLTRISTPISFIVLLVAMLAYGRFLRESPILSRMLPFSNLIVLSNWFPLFAGCMVGIAWRGIQGSAPRRCALLLPLYAVSVYSLISPLLGD